MTTPSKNLGSPDATVVAPQTLSGLSGDASADAANRWFSVWMFGSVVWQGSASNAPDARKKARSHRNAECRPLGVHWAASEFARAVVIEGAQ